MAFQFDLGVQFKQPTQPSSGVDGDKWYNTVDGSTYTYSTGPGWTLPPSNFGFFMGGWRDGLSGDTSNIERMSFPFDSGTTTTVGYLTVALRGGSQGFNSSTHGYTFGEQGYSGVQRITFPFDSGLASFVGRGTYEPINSAACNSSTDGYAACGYDPNSGTNYSIANKFTFPFDNPSIATVAGQLTGSRSEIVAVNSSLHGYFVGGDIPSPGGASSSIERLAFPFTGTATALGNLSGSTFPAAVCNSSEHGYVFHHTSGLSTIERFAFPFDSGDAVQVGNLSQSKRWSSGVNSSVYGYSVSGRLNDGSLTFTTAVERIEFPFDSGSSAITGSVNIASNRARSCDNTDFVTQFV